MFGELTLDHIRGELVGHARGLEVYDHRSNVTFPKHASRRHVVVVWGAGWVDVST